MVDRNAELDWERSVIATAVHDPTSIVEAEDLLPSDFTGPNQIAWAEVLALHANGGMDYRALVNALRNSQDWTRVSGGAPVEGYLTEVMNFRGTQMAAYAQHVVDRSTRRQLRRYAALIAAEAEDNEKRMEEILDFAENKILSLRRNRLDNDLSMADIIGIFIPRMEGMIAGTIQPGWVPNVAAIREIIDYMEEEDLMINAARPGEGKCLGRGTKVVMYGGYLLPVEQIRVGDYLLGPNSEPKRVLAVNHGRGMMYWVRQNRGIDYRVNEHHILSLKRSKNEGPYSHGEIKNISVRELLTGNKSMTTRWKGYKVAVDFPEQEVLVEPYFLGLWVGDGHSHSSMVTNTDPEVIQYLYEYAERRGEVVHGYNFSYRIVPATRKYDGKNTNSLTRALAKIGALDNKRIPNSYLINSRRVRLELLAGIIDSDGHMIHNGIEITMQNLRLMGEIKYLADTLGFRTSRLHEKHVRCQTGAERTAYRITIHGDFTDCPIRIPRKRPDNSTKRVDWRMTGIRIEQDKVDDYYGFELEGDGLFLLEDMTVTHNSSWMRWEFYRAARDHQKPVAILNYENAPIEYARYFLAMETRIDSKKLKNPRSMTQEEREAIRAAAQLLARLPIRVVTTPRTISAALSAARKLVASDHIQLLGVDYLQLLNNGVESRVNDLALTTGALRQFSLDYHIPVIANSQLSREIERRGNGENGEGADPQLSDLRESGSLEQDGTVVMFPRPMRTPSGAILSLFPENYENGVLLMNRPRVIPTYFHILKNRNGSTGKSEPVAWYKHLDTYRTLTPGALEGRQ